MNIILRLSAAVLIGLLIFFIVRSYDDTGEASRIWQVQSVDTVKHSRDEAQAALDNPEYAKKIQDEIGRIAGIGATHVAIGTPYDEEFLPVLRLWVDTARQYGLRVWFRGNWSGWEQWFGYPRINRDEHLRKTEEFILTHTDLFADGDIFTPCPECENGGPGDPRRNRDLKGHRRFLIDEYEMTKAAFQKIGKAVVSNFNSMNGDVARFVMDREATAALGGIVTIDHYVGTPNQLIADIREIAETSGGQIVLGELGVPILDIHGSMSEQEQALWLEEALALLEKEESVVGINYWVSTGGSTGIWNSSGQTRAAVGILAKYYLTN